MRKMIGLAALLLTTAGCHYASIDAGEAGVVQQHPWFFGHGGVGDDVIQPGTAVVAWSTDVDHISTTPTAFEVPFDNLMPSNSIPLDFHTVVRMQITDPVVLVKNWNGASKDKDGNPSDYWFWGNIQPIYVNMVRQEVKKYDMNQLALTGEAVDAVEAAVTKRLNAYVKQNKMPVRLLSITLGKAGLPKEILDQKTETAAQQQRILTMEAQKNAEDARKMAEQSRAAADNAYRAEMSMSPEQFVDLERIHMQDKVCSAQTCTFIIGNGTPVISH